MRHMIIAAVICSVSGSVLADSSHTVVTAPKHAKKKQPSYRQLQEQLGQAIRAAFTTTRSALEWYANVLCDTTSHMSYHIIQQRIRDIADDQRMLQEYVDQMMTGTPAISRAQMHERIQNVEHIQQRWNIL